MSSADYSDMPATNKASRFSYCHYERPVSGQEESALSVERTKSRSLATLVMTSRKTC